MIPEGIRTPATWSRNPLLYPLSYGTIDAFYPASAPVAISTFQLTTTDSWALKSLAVFELTKNLEGCCSIQLS